MDNIDTTVDINMETLIADNSNDEANHLVNLIKHLIAEEQYDGIGLLFTTEAEYAKNSKSLPKIADHLLEDVCLKFLNDDTYEKKPDLYSCASELLKLIASEVANNAILLELLELVEEQQSDNVYTSALHALQNLLLKLGDANCKALDWALNSVASSLTDLELPKSLTSDLDPRQQNLLEQNKQVDRILARYITVGLFYEPLLKDVLSNSKQSESVLIFRDCSRSNRRTLLSCFFIRLLSKPLALLDLTDIASDKKTNGYTSQVSKSLIEGIMRLFPDPFYFLIFVESRTRWVRRLNSKKEVYEMSSRNMFTIEESCPFIGLGTFYYLLLVEKAASLENAPKVYTPLFFFESLSYLAVELICLPEPSLQMRGLLLLEYGIKILGHSRVPYKSLDFELPRNVCTLMCDLMGCSNVKDIRAFARRIISKYIGQFDDKGRYLIIMNSIRESPHISFTGLLTIMYKDFVAEALMDTPPTEPLAPEYRHKKFNAVILKYACDLPAGVKTDILDNMERISSGLSVLYFFAQNDDSNRTGFWDIVDIIKRDFLNPLREGLDFSVAHYKAELYRSEHFLDSKEIEQHKERFKNLKILKDDNAGASSSEPSIKIDREQKMHVLKSKLCNFDLMYDRLGLLTDVLEQKRKQLKQA